MGVDCRVSKCAQLSRWPQLVKPQSLPHDARQPARTPLSRTLELQLAQTNLHNVCCASGYPIIRKQRDLPLRTLVENLDGLTSRFALTVVDLSQVQHLTLHDPMI